MKDISFENELMNLIRTINLHMNNSFNRFYAPYGLTRPQAIVLSEVCEQKSITVCLLAEKLNMTYSNLSLITQRLERTGFLIRQRDLQDQRVVMLLPSEKAINMIQDVQSHVSTMVDTMVGKLEQQEKEEILHSLHILEDLLCDKGC